MLRWRVENVTLDGVRTSAWVLRLGWETVGMVAPGPHGWRAESPGGTWGYLRFIGTYGTPKAARRAVFFTTANYLADYACRQLMGACP